MPTPGIGAKATGLLNRCFATRRFTIAAGVFAEW